uniref:Uncharacterized protein n=1 Tax=Populus trichocarpa TaxID=3694 RepID=A0A2K1X969_POPTR
MGIKPSPVSFVKVFPALSVRDLKNANDYRMLVKMGSEYVNDLYVVSSMIFMSAELGCVDFARKNNFLVEGINLFLQAVETEQMVLDRAIFLSSLTAVSQLQCLDLAQELHAFVIKNLAVLPVMMLNAVIVTYSGQSLIYMVYGNIF